MTPVTSPISILARKIVSLVSFLLLSLYLNAQTADFLSYGVEEGLSQSEVQCVFQDSRGYLWVGTTGGGVCSFDGVKFVEYGKKNGLVGQIVNCIAEDSTGTLWFGTQTGLSRFDGKNFTNYRSDVIGFDAITSIVTKKESVWIGGAYGVSEFSISSGAIKKYLLNKPIRSLALDETGTIWGGGGKTLYHFDGAKFDTIDLKLPADYNGSIFSLCSDQHGILYIGMSDRFLIYRTSTGTFSENLLTQTLKDKTTHSVYIDHQQKIWAATTTNLVVTYATNGELAEYDSRNGLTAEGIFMITEDNTHHMWFATREQSLLKLRSETFSYYANLPGMGSGTVFRIMEDKTGKIWVGSNQDGLYCYDGTSSVPVLNNGKPFKQSVTTAEDKNNGVWVGHYEGASLIQNSRIVKTILQGTRVRSLLMDSKGTLWVGTWGKGLYAYTPSGELKNYTKENNSLLGNYVHALCEDRKGNIWIGTGAGLTKYDGTSFHSFGEADGLCNAYVGSLAVDAFDHIWFHTDACVMRYDGNEFKSYTDEDGFASNTFYLIAFDRDSNMWIGTNKGIDRVEVDDVGKIRKVKNYSKNEGFRGIECNSRAVCVGRDGSLWFGTVKGVIRYNPIAEKPEIIQPIVHISAIRLFLEQTDWTWTGVKEEGFYHLPVSLELDYERNHLTFAYQAVHLQNQQDVQYQFMLSGFDSTWQPVTSATEITYTNLPPGHYIFKVKAFIEDGAFAARPSISCPITILPPPPPFYARWWFILLSVLCIGGILYYIIVGRTRRIVRQKKELEELVRERTAEISRQNEEKTLMLKEIHHRVKNNLQVISSLLNLQADGISDERVLVLFEDLRHRVNSMALIHEKMYQSKNLVNIDIGSYIDELVRSLIDAYDSNKSIHLKTDIEEHPLHIDTIVPLGLILNEIISNSLKYAFVDRTEGDLTVSLKKTGANKYLLIVADNGRGIAPGVKFETAESLGMQLIHMLSGQINAKVVLTVKEGTQYRIEFEEEIKDRF